MVSEYKKNITQSAVSGIPKVVKKLFCVQREDVNAFIKLLQLYSPDSMGQQVSPCYHGFLTVTQSYHSKMTPIGALHAEKIAQVVLLYVLRIAFPASLICLWRGLAMPNNLFHVLGLQHYNF